MKINELHEHGFGELAKKIFFAIANRFLMFINVHDVHFSDFGAAFGLNMSDNRVKNSYFMNYMKKNEEGLFKRFFYGSVFCGLSFMNMENARTSYKFIKRMNDE